MKYLVVLTASEAKKFIAKSLIDKHKGFKKALMEGNMLIHPSTSTVFIYEAIMGEKPEGLWFCGAIAPKGTCISKEFEEIAARRKKGYDQHDVTYSWFFKKSQLFQGIALGECLEKMGPGDYYLKGVNVIDQNGNAGVLTANRDGGTIARAMAKAKQKNFEIMLFASNNKLINISVEEAAKIVDVNNISGSMGIPAGLFKVKGTLITEVEAFQLHEVKASPIASGGLCEAEGACVFVLEGQDKAVLDCLKVIEQCKGAHLDVTFPDCDSCRYDKCPNSIINLPRG